MSVLVHQANITFGSAVNYSTGTSCVSLALADLNGNGNSDLAVAEDMSMLLNLGNGAFSAPLSYGEGFGAKTVAAANLNGDGKADLAAVSGAAVSGTAVSVLLKRCLP